MREMELGYQYELAYEPVLQLGTLPPIAGGALS